MLDSIPQASSDGLYVTFTNSQKKNNWESEKAGKDVFAPVVRVHIKVIADQQFEHVAEVTEEHKKRFPTQWKAFLEGKDASLSVRTQFSDMPGLDEMSITALKSKFVFDVEALSTLSDTMCRAIGIGTFDLRTRAEQFLKIKQDEAMVKIMRLVDDVSKKEDQIAALTKRLAALEVAPKAK